MISETFHLNTPLTHNATLTSYRHEDFRDVGITQLRPAVIICPGGGYRYLAAGEGEPVALAMLAQGFDVFVLNYSLKPVRWPAQLLEAAAAVTLVREHADSWHLDPDHITLGGFSAGGHLAASLGVNWHRTWLAEYGFDANLIKPNAMLLGYSVISASQPTSKRMFTSLLGEAGYADAKLCETASIDNHVDANTPPAFIWTTSTDQRISPANSLALASAMVANRRPFALHIFGSGAHGLGLGNTPTTIPDQGFGEDRQVKAWPALFRTWHQQLWKTVEEK